MSWEVKLVTQISGKYSIKTLTANTKKEALRLIPSNRTLVMRNDGFFNSGRGRVYIVHIIDSKK